MHIPFDGIYFFWNVFPLHLATIGAINMDRFDPTTRRLMLTQMAQANLYLALPRHRVATAGGPACCTVTVGFIDE